MENKIKILASTLEGMLADAENRGEDGIQPKLTPDDVALILKALNSYEDFCQTLAQVASVISCGAITDIHKTDCKECGDTYACRPSDDCIDPRSKKPLPFMQREIADTAAGMTSPDYKERFRAEYIQTKIRYERLKAFNTKIEAANRTNEWRCRYEMPKVEMPKHDCPDDILEQQQHLMGQYLHILEVRAVIEGVDLGGC